MSATKRLGIWMDHASAHLMEYTGGPIQTEVITSKFTNQEKNQSISKNENLMHNQEQQMHGAYYKRLGEVIQKYERVLIFGPTQAKQELANLLKEDHRFAKIKIDVKSSDQMTEPQEHAFVREYFSDQQTDN